jgi:hypothetical protein
VTLVLTQAALKGINDALMQAPYIIARPIIDDINRQILEKRKALDTKLLGENHAPRNAGD